MASLSDIQTLADGFVREFQKEKVILCGSHVHADGKTGVAVSVAPRRRRGIR